MLVLKIWFLFSLFVIINADADGDQADESPPPAVAKALETVDEWSYNIFALAEATNGQPMKHLAYYLFELYGILSKFKIKFTTLGSFIDRIEVGYSSFNTTYHNNLHGADIIQTMHFIISNTGLKNWMTDLEIFASIFAAIIHDYEHMGTTNHFHVMTESERAQIYNDRSVNENHHLSAAFRVAKEDCCNIFSTLSLTEYRQLRELVIDMVLSTDMAFHFKYINEMKEVFNSTEPDVERSKALSLVLHCSDISNAAKNWSLHQRWVTLLMEEFFTEGDLEQKLGVPLCPLCDRNTNVPNSQIGFIDIFVEPCFVVVSEMIEAVLSTSGTSAGMEKVTIPKPWIECITENRKKWSDMAATPGK